MKIERKKTEPKKDMMIRVRVTQDEHAKFFRLADENGYSTISDFIRSLIAEDNQKEQKSEMALLLELEVLFVVNFKVV